METAQKTVASKTQTHDHLHELFHRQRSSLSLNMQEQEDKRR
ncbi:hypothetical protein CCACVL1_12123 [Corchorus capsularis]|uniref:Uncharacterized protein n=1 Tax=Corchorus capsularis TaxID=210143 RepID=A0A1R3IH90_COCAP|nr:hypothetical protein CCACVL1_12123 [Corchorus capsularis]